MSECTPIKWDEVASELDRAPSVFLRKASSMWQQRLCGNQQQQCHRSPDTTCNDSQQQARWKTAYEAANEELLYSGKFEDKGETIHLLQSVKLVKRTKKQLHVVAAYTLYRCVMTASGMEDLWSTRGDGGLFGTFYANWVPVTRYRLLRVSKDRLFRTELLNITSRRGTNDALAARASTWKQLCKLCLFADEHEYARWHLRRYEPTVENPDTSSRAQTGNVHTDTSSAVDFHAILGLSGRISKKEIKAAYRRMAMKHHPDRGGSTDQFHKIRSAYAALCGKGY